MRRLFLVACSFVLLVTRLQAQEEALDVLATSTIIADIAQNVGGEFLSVQSLVPPNTDIHAFEPLPSDLRLVEEADILLINGAGLEEFLGRMLENVSTVEPIVVGTGIEILSFEGEAIGLLGEEGICEEHHEDATEEAHEHGECDPHYWENPQNAMIMAENIAAIFAEADPANADVYFANAAAYIEELQALDAEIEEILTVIPVERRLIITNHDFLAYFAARYDFEVLATVIPSVTTVAEPSPQEISNLVNVIRNEGINVIFAEAGDSNRLAEVVASEVGGDLQIVSLYSGALGDVDSPANSYINYMRTNAETIAEALGE